jgi:hypothetical protein
MEKFIAAGYCAVDANQAWPMVFEKRKTGSAKCVYESFQWQEEVPKRKCPWYLSCSPDWLAQRELYGHYMEEGLNKLGARGFHLFLVGQSKPVLERDESSARRYEYRMIELDARASEEVNLAAREEFSVVTLAGNGWGKYYIVMERSNSPKASVGDNVF